MAKLSSKSKLGDTFSWAIWVSVIASMILLLAACGPSIPPEEVPPTPKSVEENDNGEAAQESNLPSVDSAYPPDVNLPEQDEAYPVEPAPLPAPTQPPDSYPAVVEELFAEPRFRLDLPLTAEDSVVNGQAPPNLALAVVDVSSGGIVLGSGVSDADGRFSIGVPGLPDGHRVGITFSELQPGKTHPEMSQEYFPHRGEGFINIPNVGIFFDSTLIES